MHRFLPIFGLCLFAGPLLAQVPASAPEASSAEVHRLEVRDGVIYHDGVALPQSAVPEGIDLHGFPPAAMAYRGDETPAIEVDGRVFAFKNNRLVEVQNVVSEAPPSQGYAIWQARSVQAPALAKQAALDMEQEYMESLSENDRALYDQLVREREMEQDTDRLARDYRRATSDSEREAIQAKLRKQLGAMFDLKQENRREEVRQMEEALTTLRQRMDERRAMRDKIIEHRLRELLGQ